MPQPEVDKLSGGSLIVAWQLKGKNVLIVGGGDVASGRIENILIADARITLIAPSSGLHPRTKAFIDASDRITYHDRTFAGPEDLEGVDMVLTAIDDVEKSREICALSRARRIPTNVADIPPNCDFYFGSTIQKLPLQIMISTNGKGPRLAHIIREKIEHTLPANIAQAIERVGELRAQLRKRAPGVGGDLGKNRMAWMTDVCDKWELEELAQLDEDTMQRLLDEGWEKSRVPTFAEVGRGAPRTTRVPDWPFTMMVPFTAGMFVGAVGTAIIINRLLAGRH